MPRLLGSVVIGPYVVEVEASTHDDLRAGVLAIPRGPGRTGLAFSRVVVSADEVGSDAEACLVAAQVVACTSGGMPTSTLLVSWPLPPEPEHVDTP